MGSRLKLAAASAALAFSSLAHAVYVGTDGLGQALIYPYYTVQSANGDAFNTYVSIVNHAADAKALRVRFRESRNGRDVGQFNVYLAPGDVWTGALVPDTASGGARIISTDVSCNSVGEANPVALTLSTASFTDGDGSEAARTREGFVEVIEMASITDTTLVKALTHVYPTDEPTNCGSVEPSLAAPNASVRRAPSGGLSGALTLINVASGMNFTVNAEALDGLATKPFFRRAPDAYVAFDAQEIDPVSVVEDRGSVYRATWSRGVDAVSAALMRYNATAEFVLDTATASRTEVVATFPTRHFYLPSVAGAPMAAPFTGKAGWSPDCKAGTAGAVGDALYDGFFDREGSGILDDPRTSDFPEPPPASLWACASSAVLEVNRDYPSAPPAATALLGSTSRGFSKYGVLGRQNGWLMWGPYYDARLTSLPSSVRVDANGATTTAAQTYYGFPVTGFFARSFSNGTLSCASGHCMGNYGGAYPLQYVRKIATP